ncbi:conserved hypothetical protein [Theileria equi strain WA]|uniref:Signal peptide containing protein n=1 Tax=Theileria equi strain WA TaxID=1537102 RepID=L1LC52_THEEQ|nr:conserved hypothetical protein [Theileria equi strain WA]EKX72820.1 conserved hypothetical protein [Theileria equi strain WA]|eukprot:XP_004832272.1 conserved hypothetical protein [Theileria equi strain WA]
MNVLGVLHLVLLVRSCVATLTDSQVEGGDGGTKTTAKPTKELVVPITLDLAEVNTNSVDVPDTTTKDGINTTYYYPKGKFYFEKIVDGTRTVWESTKEKCSPAYTISKGNVTFLALLLKKSDDETDLIYYEKKNLGWKLVEKTKSENIIEELKRQPEQPAVKTIDLDLSDVDSTAFSVEESEEDKVPLKKFAVKTDHHLNEINYGDSELWKSDSPDKHCTLATVYFEEENPMLLSLTLNQGFVYLQKNGTEWKSISQGDCDVALVKIKELASLPKPKIVELNVNDIDDSAFTVKEETVEGLPLKTVTPKEGVLVSSVMDGEKEVWKGVDKEHALSVLVYYDGESPASVVVNFVKADGKKPWRYHHKQGDGWEGVNKEDHEKFLEELKKEVLQSAEQLSNLPSSDPNTLDITKLDSSKFSSFEYIYDDNLTQLIAPNKDTTVTRLMNDKEEVWTPGENEEFGYARVYLDENREPRVINVASIISSKIEYNYFVKNGTKWEHTTECAEKTKLKVKVEKSDTPIDLAKTEDTDKCRVVNVELLNAPTRFHLPTPEYHSNNVKSGNKNIWTATGDERCMACAIYSKNGVSLLSLFIRAENELHHKYFEKSGKEWKDLTHEVFFKKYKEMRNA